jgi:tetratricopeptide (TPR) repeat protein
MLVEDHPLDYKDFEGIIPAGNYGAGTVIVWDWGTYEPLEVFRTKKEKEKNLLKNFAEGSIKIKMYGKKLKGEFALVRTKGRGENSWLLIKHRDEYASEEDITLQDASVITGKRLEDLKATPKKKREETEKVKGTKSQASSPDALEKAKDAEEKQDFEQAIKFYQQEIKERPQHEHSYQRLMVVYRKLKKYKEELKVIEAGIQAFEELNERKTGQLVADNDKIKKLSAALMKSLGMQDKKGNPLYEPEPIAKWKKRRQIVEKKIKG